MTSAFVMPSPMRRPIVESMTVGLARRGGDRAHPAQGCESRFGPQALWVVPGGDEQGSCYVGPDTDRLEERRGRLSGEPSQLSVKGSDLRTQLPVTPGDGPKGELCCGGRRHHVAGPQTNAAVDESDDRQTV